MSFEGLFCLLFQVHDTAFNAQASACQTHRAMYDGLVGDGSNIDGDASVMVSTNLLCFVWTTLGQKKPENDNWPAPGVLAHSGRTVSL